MNGAVAARWRAWIDALPLPDGVRAYPWLGVTLATLAVTLMLVAGSAAIDATFRWQAEQDFDDPRYRDMPGTCYWAGDVRNYMHVALDGYSGYDRALLTPHLTYLDMRSWWPLFPYASSLVIEAGGGQCSSRTVNGVAYILLVPLMQALTGERRWWRLLLLGLLPFGAWLYVGEADTFFLALSALLLLIMRQGSRWPRGAALAAFGMGIVVGIAKPNGLAMLPALGVWALLLTRDHWRALGDGENTHDAAKPRPRWRRFMATVGDRNPGWAPILGGAGILLANVWWIWQTSGYYPYYVLMVQRSLWWKEFTPGDFGTFAHTYYYAMTFTVTDRFSMTELQRLTELAAMALALAVALAGLPPRWPGAAARRIALPLHWRLGILSMLALMFFSGQSHAIERYAVSNVFFVLAYWRLLFGAPGQRVDWRIWTLPGLLRWLLLLAAPATWIFSYLLLGWNPLDHWP